MTARVHMRQAPAGRSIGPDVEETNRISAFPSIIHTVLVFFWGGGGESIEEGEDIERGGSELVCEFRNTIFEL